MLLSFGKLTRLVLLDASDQVQKLVSSARHDAVTGQLGGRMTRYIHFSYTNPAPQTRIIDRDFDKRAP